MIGAARGIRARLANVIAAAAGLAVALLLAETGVRLLWTDAPARVASADTLPLHQIRDAGVLYRLVPGSSGQYNGTDVTVNSLGLRDRELAIPKPAGVKRILVLGDSMVFGVGVPAGETLSANLSRVMRPDEAINAGVFGYNLDQEISLLRDIGFALQPDVVVACFVHNDIENWGLGDGGAVPEIRSGRFTPPPADAWSTRLADLMLPGRFDAERANLLPAVDGSGGLRGWFSSVSRLYLFTYLRLRTHSWSLTGGEVRDPLVDTPSCQTRELIWEGLGAQYGRLRSMVERSGARLLVVIHGGLLWEGGPARELRHLLARERIPFLDLSPVWLDREFYAAQFSLGWDPHPNSRANALAAELIGEHLRRSPEAAGPHDVIAGRPDLAERLARWREREAMLIDQERARWSETVARFLPAVSLAAEAGGSGPAQILHGFWDGATGPAPPGGAGAPMEGRWMSKSGSVLLGNVAGARRVIIELAAPGSAGPGDRAPRSLRVTLGSPPAGCAALVLELPVGEPIDGAAVVQLSADLPAGLGDAGIVEVGLSVDRAFPATYLDPDRSDPRLVSFFVRRVGLQ